MRTTINVMDSIFEEIMVITGARTKTEAVNRALQEFVRLKRKQELINLSGKIHIEENWKEIREAEKSEG